MLLTTPSKPHVRGEEAIGAEIKKRALEGSGSWLEIPATEEFKVPGEFRAAVKQWREC